MRKRHIRTLELLAPARDLDTAIAAISAGADAVYIGGPTHGARQAASNSVEDISRLCEFAHRFRARVYVTLNTLVYDSELNEVESLVKDLYQAGVDALIVQDMALLRMNIPPIALHASTQCDTRTPEKARFLEQAGFSQIVLPREFSLDEIKAVADTVSVPLEAFVHGALCVCYSGDCRASLVSGGRSANRGECAQICRLPYDLVDGEGRTLIADRHLISLRDLNRMDSLREMADAGVSSFKIEGRLKSKAYVVNVVRAYSRALDDICRQAPECYRRLSAGRVQCSFDGDVSRAFNRGFTSYFLRDTKPPKGALSSPLSPKFTGLPIGKLISAKDNILLIDGKTELHNGDGITWIDRRGKLAGARINRVDRQRIILRENVSIAPGTEIFRNFDKQFDDMLEALPVRRFISLSVRLRKAGDRIAADITDLDRKLNISSAISTDAQPARTPQGEVQRDVFARLGDTVYTLAEFSSDIPECFISRSELTRLRRAAIDALDHAASATRPLDLRRKEDSDAPYVQTELTFHDNVANSLAAGFYRDHGVTDIAPAMEISPADPNGEIRVMTSRFCLRRELGACLKTPDAHRLPAKLYLRPTGAAANVRTMRIDCDCSKCHMHLIALPSKKTL